MSIVMPHAQQEAEGFEGIKESECNRIGDEGMQVPGREDEEAETDKDEEEETEGRGEGKEERETGQGGGGGGSEGEKATEPGEKEGKKKRRHVSTEP